MINLFRAILVETRNICNRDCWFCKFGQERQDGAITQMEWSTIRRILENLRALEYSGRISWYNINEPLLDKRMPEILKLTRELCPRAFVSFATNGDLLNEAVYSNLKQCGLDAVGVSVYDDTTFEKVRKFADPQMVLIDMRTVQPGVLENRGGGIRQEAAAFEEYRSRFENRSCERPSEMMVVDSQGRVVLCCADMYGDAVMGDARIQKLEEIWNNERFALYRARLRDEGRRNLPLCKDCSYSGKGFKPYFPFNGNQPRPRLRDRIRSKLGLFRTHRSEG